MLKQGDEVVVTGQKGKNRSWEQKNKPTEDQNNGKYLNVSVVGTTPKWDSDMSGIFLKVSLHYSALPQCIMDPSGHITVMRAASATAVRAHSTRQELSPGTS